MIRLQELEVWQDRYQENAKISPYGQADVHDEVVMEICGLIFNAIYFEDIDI